MDDTATSELRTSTASGPSRIYELGLSTPAVRAVEINATTSSGVDTQSLNLHSSLERHTNMIEVGPISNEESGELNVMERPSKRIRLCELGNIEENKNVSNDENLKLKSESLEVGNGSVVAGPNNLASSSEKDLSWPNTSKPVDLKMATLYQSEPERCLPGPSSLLCSHQLTFDSFNKVRQCDSQVKQSMPLHCIFSLSKSKDNSDFIQGTVPSPGLEPLINSLIPRRPNYSHNICKTSNGAITHSSNISTHVRDETLGNISNPVTSCDNETFQLDHSPMKLGQSNGCEWRLPLLAGQHIRNTEFQNGSLSENMNLGLHDNFPFEGKRLQGLGLSQRGTELVSDHNTIFDLSLASVFSSVKPNTSVPDISFEMQPNPDMFLQNLQVSTHFSTCSPFLPSLKSNESMLCNSGPPGSHFDVLQSLHQKALIDSFLLDRGRLPSCSNVFNSAKDCPTLISDLNLSLIIHSKLPSSSLAQPHSFPYPSERFASASNPFLPTQEMGTKHIGLLTSTQDNCGSSIDLDNNEISRSISVVMEGRPIEGSVCLQKLDGYESFAFTMSDMFKNITTEDNMTRSGGDCSLSNVIPGFMIAYEDAEGDLLLAGDLSWRDFVRVARRIRVIPTKKNKTKGSF